MSSHQALLHIIVNDCSLTDGLVNQNPEKKKHITATIGTAGGWTKQELLERLRNIFDRGLFGIHNLVPKSTLASVEFKIRWVGDNQLLEMLLEKQTDFARGLALMEARGWKDTLVAYCEMEGGSQ